MGAVGQIAGILCLILCSRGVFAQSIPLQNLDSAGLSQIVGDLSTNFLHTTVSGASPLGHLYGFEVGVVGGQTLTPHINSLAQSADPSASASKVYDAALIGVLTVPLGLTAEVGLVPKVGSSTFQFSSYSAALKWTPTELFGDLPLSLATKLSYTKSTLDMEPTINNVPTDIGYTNTETALTLIASKNFVLVEPYFGVGYVSATGNMTASGNTTVFNSSFTSSGSASATRTGAMWMLGTEVKLLVVKLGVEYTNMFSTSRVMGKLSLFF